MRTSRADPPRRMPPGVSATYQVTCPTDHALSASSVSRWARPRATTLAGGGHGMRFWNLGDLGASCLDRFSARWRSARLPGGLSSEASAPIDSVTLIAHGQSSVGPLTARVSLLVVRRTRRHCRGGGEQRERPGSVPGRLPRRPHLPVSSATPIPSPLRRAVARSGVL